MDFSFTEEQNLLRNSVQGLLQKEYDFETHRKISQGEEGWRAEIWAKFAELGILAIPFEEKYGGFGRNSQIETMIVMEEFGRFLVTEPYLATVILSGSILNDSSPKIQETYLPNLIQGKKIWALAVLEPQGRFYLNQVKTKFEGGKLTGHKSAVIGGAWADYFIVSARHSGADGDEDGIGLYIVEKSASGVEVHDYRSIDGSRVAELVLEGVEVKEITKTGFAILSKAVDYGIASLCAEAAGAMKELHDATIEYCRTRKQFGVSIGSFQSLQHRMVDMFIAYEQAVSMNYMLHLHLDKPHMERAKAASATKALAGKSLRFVGENAVQLHGGMGVTDELNVGHFFKRLTVIENLFGNVDFHTNRYIKLTNKLN